MLFWQGWEEVLLADGMPQKKCWSSHDDYRNQDADKDSTSTMGSW